MVIVRSAEAVTAVVAVLALFVVLGSGLVDETVAELEMVPGPPLTFTTNENEADCPFNI